MTSSVKYLLKRSNSVRALPSGIWGPASHRGQNSTMTSNALSVTCIGTAAGGVAAHPWALLCPCPQPRLRHWVPLCAWLCPRPWLHPRPRLRPHPRPIVAASRSLSVSSSFSESSLFDISLSITFSVTKSVFHSDSPSLVLALPESVGFLCTDSASFSEFSELCHGSIFLLFRIHSCTSCINQTQN